MQTTLPHPLLPCDPPFWARGGQLQTIVAQYLPCPAPDLPWQRRTLALEDGDQLALRLLPGSSGVSVLLFHGLGGSADGHYIRSIAALLHAEGHSVLAVNHRGAGEGRGLAQAPYHGGSTRDVAAVLALGRRVFPGQLQVAVGFSISANMLLLLLGRDGALGLPDRVIAVNPPADLETCSRRLDQGFNQAWDRYFLWCLRQEVEGRSLTPALGPTQTLRAFDQLYTAPQAGFSDCQAYYDQCSCGPHLRHITVPTVIISSLDDPFAPAADLLQRQLSPAIHLHTELTGGHMGYVTRNLPGYRWLDYALEHYVTALKDLGRPAAWSQWPVEEKAG